MVTVMKDNIQIRDERRLAEMETELERLRPLHDAASGPHRGRINAQMSALRADIALLKHLMSAERTRHS